MRSSLNAQRVNRSAARRWLALRTIASASTSGSLSGTRATSGDLVAEWWRRLTGALAAATGQRRLAWALVVALTLLDVLIVGQHALVRHLAYHSEAFDLGNMDQAVWNTLHGNFFHFTNRGIDWYGPPTRLGIHVEPILLLIAPLYLFHSGAETLLVVQTVALALGALPLMALTLRRLPDIPLVGVGFVAAYLCSPALLGQALWDFHPVSLATPLLLAAIYALDARRYGWFVAAGILAAMCKEDVALALVPLGLLIAMRQGRPRLGLAVAMSSLAWAVLCFAVIIPHFNGGASASGNAYWYRYTALGDSPGSAVRDIARNPELLLAVVATPDKLGYLLVLLRTGGGLGIFAPFWWLAGLPELIINLLSAQPPQYSGFYHYNAVLLAALMAGAVYGAAALRQARLAAVSGTALPLAATPRTLAGYAERLAGWWSHLIGRIPLSPRVIGPLVVVWLLFATGRNLAGITYKLQGFWQAGSAPNPHQAQIDALLRRIPPNAVVAATDTLDPHLTDRKTIYLLPDPLAYQAQYVAVDLTTVNPAWQAADEGMLTAMVSSGRYRVLGAAGPVVLLERVGRPLDSA